MSAREKADGLFACLDMEGWSGHGFCDETLIEYPHYVGHILHPITVKAIEKPEEIPMLHMLPVENPGIVHAHPNEPDSD